MFYVSDSFDLSCLIKVATQILAFKGRIIMEKKIPLNKQEMSHEGLKIHTKGK